MPVLTIYGNFSSLVRSDLPACVRILRKMGDSCGVLSHGPLCYPLLALVKDRSVALEEYVRQMIHAEEVHAAEVDKMLRKPGEVSAFAPRSV